MIKYICFGCGIVLSLLLIFNGDYAFGVPILVIGIGLVLLSAFTDKVKPTDTVAPDNSEVTIVSDFGDSPVSPASHNMGSKTPPLDDNDIPKIDVDKRNEV